MKYYLMSAVAVATTLPANARTTQCETSQPNIILILSDDQGYRDLGCYGAKDLQTPNIDRLATDGTRFTQFYAGGPISSPSRASLLTGRSSLEAGCPGNVPRGNKDRDGNKGLPQNNRTIAENLKDVGYYTALVGKWHLGEGPEQLPDKQGFDYFFGHRGGCFDNFSHFFYWSGPNEHDLWRNNEEVYYPGSYFPDLIVEEVNAIIEAPRKEPFFIYCAFNVPHYPYQGDKKWLDYYSEQGLTTPRKEYNAFVSTMDERIGRIIDKLKQEGKYDNTLIIFQADQGYSVEERAFWGGGDVGDMRGCKGSLFEGGIRVPAIIKHNDTTPAGMVVNAMTASVDWYNTLAEVAGAQISLSSQGKSLLPLLRGKTKEHHTVMNWQVNAFDDKKGQWAVRSGDWKLISNVTDDRNPKSLTDEDKKLFLCNLTMDITESKNLAEEYPQKVAELKSLHDQWYIRVQQSTEFRFRTGK